MKQEIIDYATTKKGKEKTITEIMEKFKIDSKKESTLRKRLHDHGIKTKDTRGRKRVDL